MTKSTNSFLKPSMNWLLVFIPFTLFMEHVMPDRPVLVFPTPDGLSYLFDPLLPDARGMKKMWMNADYSALTI